MINIEISGTGQMVKMLAASLILLAFTALGIALACDFRGIATEYARRSLGGS